MSQDHHRRMRGFVAFWHSHPFAFSLPCFIARQYHTVAMPEAVKLGAGGSYREPSSHHRCGGAGMKLEGGSVVVVDEE